MQINKDKMANAIKIIVSEAITTLARVHKTTEVVIEEAIKNGNLKIEQQMMDLIAKGLQVTAQLHKTGAIDLQTQ